MKQNYLINIMVSYKVRINYKLHKNRSNRKFQFIDQLEKLEFIGQIIVDRKRGII